MEKKLQSIRGTKDLFKEECKQFNYIVNNAKIIADNFCFDEIMTPIFEFTEVFSRTLGDTSDVVNKEMYSFLDRNQESLTLRPEFTAGIVRAFISNGLQQYVPLKLFSYGPVFRYERPQKGRQRQFHQINFEILGSKLPLVDTEIISIAHALFHKLNLLEKVTLEINSLGDHESRNHYKQVLKEYFNKYKNDLSEDSKIRLEKNPLRILDSKDENDKKISISAPKMQDYLNDESKKYFDEVLQGLNNLSIKYKINHNLVRGLDYYTHTVFEFTTNDLGSQNAVIAGGRYDNLIKMMGGPETPAIGFGGGIERLMLLCDKVSQEKNTISIIPIGDNTLSFAQNLAFDLRLNNIKIDFAFNGNLNKRMKKANQINAKFAIFIGEEEINNKIVKIKNLESGQEEAVNLNNIKEYLHNFDS